MALGSSNILDLSNYFLLGAAILGLLHPFMRLAAFFVLLSTLFYLFLASGYPNNISVLFGTRVTYFYATLDILCCYLILKNFNKYIIPVITFLLASVIINTSIAFEFSFGYQSVFYENYDTYLSIINIAMASFFIGGISSHVLLYTKYNCRHNMAGDDSGMFYWHNKEHLEGDGRYT